MKIYDPAGLPQGEEKKRQQEFKMPSKLKCLAKLKLLKAAKGNKLSAFVQIVSLRAGKSKKEKLTHTVWLCIYIYI